MRGRSSASARSGSTGTQMHPGGVLQEERHRLGRHVLGGHDEVALVLAVLVVDDDDHRPRRDRRDRRLRSSRQRHQTSTSTRRSSPTVATDTNLPRVAAASARGAPGPRRTGAPSSPPSSAGRHVDDDRSTSPGPGTRARRSPRPRRAAGARLGRRGRRAARSSWPRNSKHGCTLASRGAVAEHHAQGLALDCRRGGRSARGRRRAPCPRPTSTASLSARRWCASRRAGSDVIHLDVPSGAAVRPSSVAAHLSTT